MATTSGGYFDRKYVAEFAGTLALVLIGCGSIALGGFSGSSPAGIVGIGLAFGLTVTAMAYSIGIVSGAHLNPAVTLAVWVAGRMRASDVPGYIITQFLGALVGAGILVLLISTKTGASFVNLNLGQNGFGAGTTFATALLAEFVATLIFTLVILGATSGKGATPFPGLVIGLTLTILHLPFLAVTGLSVNPARSFGPALWVSVEGGNIKWLEQIVFLIAPAIGGVVAGWFARAKIFED